jgi:hypothetical protein
MVLSIFFFNKRLKNLGEVHCFLPQKPMTSCHLLSPIISKKLSGSRHWNQIRKTVRKERKNANKGKHAVLKKAKLLELGDLTCRTLGSCCTTLPHTAPAKFEQGGQVLEAVQVILLKDSIPTAKIFKTSYGRRAV